MTHPRLHATLTLLVSGKVLAPDSAFADSKADSGVVASSDLYDPATGTWSATANIPLARGACTATRLKDGRVLVVGGIARGAGVLSDAEIYDPATGSWSKTGALTHPRSQHLAVLLEDGRVLVVGGQLDLESGKSSPTAEIYDPATSRWSQTGAMSSPRTYASIALLGDGRVLVAGGVPDFANRSRTTGPWLGRRAPRYAGREFAKAMALPDGRVLLAGGAQGERVLASAELYDPPSGRWTATGPMTAPRMDYAIALLSDGTVLVAGGSSQLVGDSLATSDVYDPSSGRWRGSAPMSVGRVEATAAGLVDGTVLLTGGRASDGSALASAEIYKP